MTTSNTISKGQFILNLFAEKKQVDAVELDNTLIQAGYGAYDTRHLSRLGVKWTGERGFIDLGNGYEMQPKIYTI